MHNTLPLRELDKSLRDRLIAELTRIGVDREEASAFTPSGSEILDRVLRRHVDDWSRHSELVKLMARAKRLRPHSIAVAISKYLGES